MLNVGSEPVIDGGFVPVVRPSTASVEIDGERVVVDEDGVFHLLDPVASVVWPFLDGSTSIEDLADDLSAAFDGDRDRISQDMLELTRDLVGRGLLSRPGQASGTPEVATTPDEEAPDDPRVVERPGST